MRKRILSKKIEKINRFIFEKKYREIKSLIREKIKNNHGVYALYNKKEQLYYIGRANDILARVNQHCRNRHSKKWSYFSIYYTKKPQDALEVEAIILSMLPTIKGNKQNSSKLGEDKKLKNCMKKLKNNIDKNNPTFFKRRSENKNNKLTQSQKFRLKFWKNFVKYMEKESKNFKFVRSPRPTHYYILNIESGFSIHFHILSRPKKQIKCFLCINNTTNSFKQIEKDKIAIGQEFGEKLEWLKKTEKVSWIFLQRDGNFINKKEWPELFRWFKDKSGNFYRTFSPRIKELEWREKPAA